MSSLDYEIVDVFTDRPFAGNPLAVVFGADDLGTDQMQALAREFHLSETVFVLPATQPDAELPFAGHPSVGAAVTQLRRGLITAGRVTQECGAGLLPIDVYAEGRANLRGGVPTVGPALDPARLLAAAGLGPDDFAGPAPREAGCGLSYTYLSVRPDAVVRTRAMNSNDELCVFAWDAAKRFAHSRVFVPSHGVSEDPATGSAALGLGVWLVASGLLPGDGESTYVIRQGAELHRPSTLECTVIAEAGLATRATVAGSVVPIATGRIAVPPFVG
jgi:trans-2,3-dihydro-3-hydroxyanthranilate isomerase